MNHSLKSIVLAVCTLAAMPSLAADWTLADGPNTGAPGRKVDVKQGDRLVARLIYGEGQFKPYLHVFGEAGELLTNAGLDESGKATGQFPHHRGIFIGWNKITSDLGSHDLWHFNNGGHMVVKKFDQLEGGRDSAKIVATIEWRAGKKDGPLDASEPLLTETRTLVISRPEGKRTQVDAHFKLVAARDLNLGGDLQHAGIHFRASNEVSTRNKESAYVTEKDWVVGAPKKGKDGKETPGAKDPAKGDLKWVRMTFPIGERWYAASEFNPPGNPVEELSWRDYGRFGFFFKKDLKKDQTLSVDYRFIIEPADAPAEKGKLSADQVAKARTEAKARHEAAAKSLQ